MGLEEVDGIDRRLHSFTLTVEASDEVRRMKNGTKSAQVSEAICKYANNFKLSPDGKKFWSNIAEDYRKSRNQAVKELEEVLNKQGVKHHLVGLLRCLNPFRPRKRE